MTPAGRHDGRTQLVWAPLVATCQVDGGPAPAAAPLYCRLCSALSARGRSPPSHLFQSTSTEVFKLAIDLVNLPMMFWAAFSHR